MNQHRKKTLIKTQIKLELKNRNNVIIKRKNKHQSKGALIFLNIKNKEANITCHFV